MPPSKNVIAATMSRSAAAQAGVLTFNSVDEAHQMATSNARKLYGFSIKQVPPGFPTEPKMYIYSIADYGEQVNVGPGFPIFEVKACPEGEDYGEACVIDPLYMALEAKVDTTEFMPTTGQQIVESILKIGAGMNASWDRRKQGWFVSVTNPPDEEDLAQAVKVYTAECQRLLAEGNRYAASNQLLEINET